VVLEGASAPTTLEAGEVACAEPALLVAVTITFRVWPTSSGPTVYVDLLAPEMLMHCCDNAEQLSHW
jgi:hypothetical protein